MRRLPRILLNAATIASALLCLAAASSWLRSRTCEDLAWRNDPGRSVGLVSSSGSVCLTLRHWNPDNPAAKAYPPWELFPGRRTRDLPTWLDNVYGADHPRFLGFATASSIDPAAPELRWDRHVLVPYWALIVLTAILPAAAFIRIHRHRRPRPGLCLTCGYDLRATPDRCPECGTIPAQ